MAEKISRRDFLKTLGVGTAGAAAAGCKSMAGRKAGTGPESQIAGEMEMRTNPNSGDSVSLLGYGCMRWPLTDGADGKQTIDQEAVNKLVDYAIEHGVNYFDTAPVYLMGQSEKATGDALARHPRESYLIATKLSNFNPSSQSFEASKAMYENSRKELGVEVIDYYLLHSIGGKGESGIATMNRRFIDNGMMDFLLKEREAGRIRNLGFSCHCDEKVFDYAISLHDKYHWDFVQIQMNYVDWNYLKLRDASNATGSYEYNKLVDLGIPVVIMEPLLGGRLSKLNDGIVEKLKERRPLDSAASWAFRFCGTYPGVLTTLSGMTYLEHLQDNLKSFCGFEPLTEDDLSFLDEIALKILKFPTVPCTACQYCMPCPYGIDIPSIFAHYNKCVTEDNIPQSKDAEGYAKARRAYLVGYDRSVPKLRQANHCIGCGQCEWQCPQNIKIPHELRRIDSYVEKLKQNKL